MQAPGPKWHFVLLKKINNFEVFNMWFWALPDAQFRDNRMCKNNVIFVRIIFKSWKNLLVFAHSSGPVPCKMPPWGLPWTSEEPPIAPGEPQLQLSSQQGLLLGAPRSPLGSPRVSQEPPKAFPKSFLASVLESWAYFGSILGSLTREIGKSLNRWIELKRWIEKSLNRWIDDSLNRWIDKSLNREIIKSMHR